MDIGVGKYFSRGFHKLVDELIVLLAPDPGVTKAQVQVILQQCLVLERFPCQLYFSDPSKGRGTHICAAIQHHWELPRRVDSGTQGRHGEFCHGNEDRPDSLVSDSEDL
jgi:hypothetical protein